MHNILFVLELKDQLKPITINLLQQPSETEEQELQPHVEIHSSYVQE